MDILIKKLNKEYLKSNLVSFIEILKFESYEYWNEENFLIELPGKFDLSYYLELNDVLVSYVISSIKQSKTAHIHKLMTDNGHRGIGLGKLILKVFEMNCKAQEINTIELSVIKSNEKAVNFYQNNGYIAFSDKVDSKNYIELLLMKKKILV